MTKERRGQDSPEEGRRMRSAADTERGVAGRERGGKQPGDFAEGKLPDAGDGDYSS